jgi:hypothetical protein
MRLYKICIGGITENYSKQRYQYVLLNAISILKALIHSATLYIKTLQSCATRAHCIRYTCFRLYRSTFLWALTKCLVRELQLRVEGK